MTSQARRLGKPRLRRSVALPAPEGCHVNLLILLRLLTRRFPVVLERLVRSELYKSVPSFIINGVGVGRALEAGRVADLLGLTRGFAGWMGRVATDQLVTWRLVAGYHFHFPST